MNRLVVASWLVLVLLGGGLGGIHGCHHNPNHEPEECSRTENHKTGSSPLVFVAASSRTLKQALASLLSVARSGINKTRETTGMHSLKQTVACRCGKVRLAIDSPSVLRLICYCRDCRGYVHTLNAMAGTPEPATPLDPWGGADWTSVYPSEITVESGHEHLMVAKIRPSSPIRRVYAGCCQTPLFSVGGMSCLLNTQLVRDDAHRAPVRFRILGRQALRAPDGSGPPGASWSVPLSWFWTMPGRINKKKMEPLPLDLSEPQLLEGFKEG